ncbi:MAG: hypothetical protein AAF589_09315 [Planctomycetota bacterium]
MLPRFLIRSALIAVLAGAAAVPAQAGGWLEEAVAKEKAIKSMPIECRPNRLGHVYGNNVRRLHYGRLCVNCGRYPQPVKRFFTVP